MKFLVLVLRNMVRSKRRTFFTVGSILVALFLFATLRTVVTAFNSAVEVADDTRLVVRRSTSLVFPMPLSYRDRIAQVEGVSGVTYANWFGGEYQEPQNFFAKFAVDADTYFEIHPEYLMPPDQLAAFKGERTACIVGSGLAQKFGFKIGDTIPILGTIFPHPDGGEWRFVVRGIYEPETAGVDPNTMFFRWDYLNETIGDAGMVGFYVVKLDDPSRTVSVIGTIDEKFANSSYETKTETEAAFQAGFVSMMGNIGFLVTVIGSAVVFAIVLVTFNTMMMAARERTRELATMKALGFTDATILGLIMAEATLLSLAGGVLGLLLAVGVSPVIGAQLSGFVPSFVVKPSTVGWGLLLSLGMGLFSGLVPAIQASRLSIAGALRQHA
jgi:putative ABC transport system permease protein